MIFDKHANLKYKFGNRHFWSEGYYVSTVGLNEATIRKYSAEQEAHDIAIDKLTTKEYEDPFPIIINYFFDFFLIFFYFFLIARTFHSKSGSFVMR